MIEWKWEIAAQQQPCSVEDVVRILLENRGAGPSFLSSELADLKAYLAVKGLEEGADLMARRLREDRKVVLVADYDCDGITSAAQMSLFLREIGYHNFSVVLPDREEGYGIPGRAIPDHPDAGLFVVMDCGTSEREKIERIRGLGADCLVLDHHEVPREGAAPATVLVNPKQPGCPSPFKEFCSSGLTLLFLTRLRKALAGGFPRPRLGGKYLELAAIGTIADLVPLVEGNRIIARSGMESLNRGPHGPIRAILESAGLDRKPLSAGHVGYYIGPRINAAGRVSHARIAYDLLVSETPEEMGSLAGELNRLNARRQQQEEEILEEIRRRLLWADESRKTLVLGDAGWPVGVVGIAASRIQQEWKHVPTILVSIDEKNGVARGSGRSIPGFDLHRALMECRDLLQRWGGHKAAAGVTLDPANLDAFADRFEEVARRSDPEIFVPRKRVDMRLDLGLVSGELVAALRGFEPHGLGNPSPLFAAAGTRVAVQRAFGKEGSHLRLVLNGGIEGVFWRGAASFAAGRWGSLEDADVIFEVEWDAYRNKPALVVKDVGRFFER
ncbi:MAG TPA: DHHA1 domain-containing protein [Syntrophobacteraceae bacterium]|nr:DHHA1 domain-containing protein [Syntrophobacteraceae bacterium]